MNIVNIIIDWVPNNFAATLADNSFACIATGDTLEEVKDNIVEAIKFHIEGLILEGEPLPKQFCGKWSPCFELSTRAQLKYCDLYITRKALAKETGINEQQLSHYANGQRHPRPAMQSRITAGIRSISNRLSGII